MSGGKLYITKSQGVGCHGVTVYCGEFIHCASGGSKVRVLLMATARKNENLRDLESVMHYAENPDRIVAGEDHCCNM